MKDGETMISMMQDGESMMDMKDGETMMIEDE